MALTGTAPGAASIAGSMRPVVDAIGYAAALALATRFGGMELYLRSQPAEDDLVTLVIGPQARDMLLRALGPGRWEVPRCQAWLLARRDEEIRLRYEAGEPVNDLAFSFRLTRRHILRVIADDAAPCKAALPQQPESAPQAAQQQET